ncbi:glycine betaine ABC transporter substrate-binding protein [Martelella mediterranea]|uniref:Glycine betaine/choline ABC-type transport system substrate-binding protein n=1 Tax=Martelella mediterranea TaxID=293089 RepID=A0A4R3NNF1_9HYPH|nr:glycine betaine ABC transporter substrate-binding protein [Martelella mediterranea]TCT33021.1 glycine betaine/choline ABC-type transport system substrate-binding protein [Martelella mediterranea]
MRTVLSLLIVLVLASCSSQTVRVGSKDLVENRIVAEMFALLLEEQGVNVKRLPALGSTEIAFQALKDDDIDLYPEYTGTALSMMGEPRSGDADQDYEVVSEALATNGLVMLDRLGFEAGYAVLTRPAVAAENDLSTILDLTGPDTRLRLGITQSFAERPRDGLEPFLDRFGLSFGDITVFSEANREGLYDALIEKRVDVIVGFTTDPEIEDYELVELDDTTGFFPIYEAAPLTSDLALERSPVIETVMAELAGRIDNTLIEELNAAVRLDGRPVNRVARRALFDLGLIEKPPRERTPVLGIAMQPETVGTDAGISTLRAVRKAMRGRDVNIIPVSVPLEAMAGGDARLALAPAVSGFSRVDGNMVRDDRVEAVAAVGSTFLHAISLTENPVEPVNASVIASGPEGSATFKMATVLAATAGGDVTIVPLADDEASTAAEALRKGDAQVALLFAEPGRQDLADLFAGSTDITLVDADAWWRSRARLALPVMREAQINAGTYAGLNLPVSTLSTQLILFGPAAPEGFALGQQGPSSFFDEVRPLQGRNVEAINNNLGLHAAVDPHLRRAAALTPDVNIRDDRINPYPGRAVLMIVILAFAVWAFWLFLRPEKKGDSR